MFLSCKHSSALELGVQEWMPVGAWEGSPPPLGSSLLAAWLRRKGEGEREARVAGRVWVVSEACLSVYLPTSHSLIGTNLCYLTWSGKSRARLMIVSHYPPGKCSELIETDPPVSKKYLLITEPQESMCVCNENSSSSSYSYLHCYNHFHVSFSRLFSCLIFTVTLSFLSQH